MALIYPDERPPNNIQKYSVVGYKKDVIMEGNVRLINTVDFPSEVMCCRYNNNEKYIAVGTANGIIKIYAVDSRSIVYSLRPPGDHYLPVTSICWKPDKIDQEYGNILLSTYASGYVRLWHVTTGKCIYEYCHGKVQMMTCAYDSSGDHFAVGRSDGKIDVHNAKTFQVVMVMEPSTNSEIMDGHVMRIFSVVFHPSVENLFVSAGWDDTVQWWDKRQKHSIKKLSGPHVCGEGLDIHPETSNMLVASWRKDRNLQVFDFGTGKIITDIPSSFDDKSMLYCGQWLTRDKIVSGGSHNNVMKYTDMYSKQTVGRVYNLPSAVYSVHCSKSSPRRSVVFCASKALHIIEDTM